MRKNAVKRWISLALLLCLGVINAFPCGAAAAPEVQQEIFNNGSQGDGVLNLQMRLRDLGYYNYKITGYYGLLTVDAVCAFQDANDLTVDGSVGPETAAFLYSNAAKRRPPCSVAPKAPKLTPAQAAEAAAAAVHTGEKWDWFTQVEGAFPRGGSALVKDVWTGITYTMVRVGGSNHADVEPATQEDCQRLKASYGGVWAWNRRPVLVKIGDTWVAGSTNGMPHGYETVPDNGMTGQVCIHFLNSKTHIRNMKDSDHQAMVRVAAGE